ncbi:MAG: helix-turn-helix domain-containing protein [Thermaerobacter sp.]|nr:helix-turn-helix domain-containing protein [Thermaerobacter sp.]
MRFPPADLAIPRAEPYPHPHPRVQQKLHTLYWVGLGYPRHEVARIIGVSEGTVRSALHAYQAGGLAALRQFNPHPHTAAWDRQATTLREAFTAQPPHTGQEAGDRIAALTGVRRSPTPSGRQRVNGLGSLPAITPPAIPVTHDTTINRESVVTLRKKWAAQFTDRPIPSCSITPGIHAMSR